MSNDIKYCDREPYGTSSKSLGEYSFTPEFYTNLKKELQKVFDIHYKKFLKVFENSQVVSANLKEELIPLMFVVSQISVSYIKYGNVDADTNLLLGIFSDWMDKLDFKNDIHKIYKERFHLYTIIILNEKMPRYEWLMFREPKDNSNLILRCCAVFGDILINPNCANDYDNAPVIIHDFFQIKEFSLMMLKFQYFIKDFHDEITAFYNAFHQKYRPHSNNVKINDMDVVTKSLPSTSHKRGNKLKKIVDAVLYFFRGK